MTVRRSKIRVPAIAGVLLWALGLGGCVESPSGPVVNQVIEEVTFAASLGIDLSTMTETTNGVYYLDEIEGAGPEFVDGEWGTMNYTGQLSNAQFFDANVLVFQMGEGQVVPGLEEGARGAREGSTRLIIIPPELGYGTAGFGPVPGGAIMIFRIELTRVASDPPPVTG